MQANPVPAVSAGLRIDGRAGKYLTFQIGKEESRFR